MAEFSVEINAPCFLRWQKSLSSDALVDDVYKVWSKMYDAYIRQRFTIFSRGGGDWAELAARTIAAKGSTSILVDTGLLFRSLHPKLVQQADILVAKLELEGAYPLGVNITDVARFHQFGTRYMPAREILVTPEAEFQKQMVAAAQKVAFKHMGLDHSNIIIQDFEGFEGADIGEAFASGKEIGQIFIETITI